MRQSLVATKDLAQVPQEVVQPALISVPVVTLHKKSATGTPVSYGTTSPALITDIQQTIYPPTPIAPLVVTTMVPDVLPMPKPHTVTYTGPPKQPRPRQRATDTP